jgi:hypothetical protein
VKFFIATHNYSKGQCAYILLFISLIATITNEQIKFHIIISCFHILSEDRKHLIFYCVRIVHLVPSKRTVGGAFHSAHTSVSYFFLFLICKKIKPPIIKATNTTATIVLASITHCPPSSFFCTQQRLCRQYRGQKALQVQSTSRHCCCRRSLVCLSAHCAFPQQ